MKNVWDEVFKSKKKKYPNIQEDMPRIIKFFKAHKVKNVLDLGYGSGRHTVYLARQGFNVFGIDSSRVGKNVTIALLKKRELKAKLILGDIYEKLPYGDNFFDAIVSTQTLHHERIGKIRKLISETERILKPDGFVFITVLNLKAVEKSLLKKIGPQTFVYLHGHDKGVPHYMFNRTNLHKELADFKILDIRLEKKRNHYCLLGQLKK